MIGLMQPETEDESCALSAKIGPVSDWAKMPGHILEHIWVPILLRELGCSKVKDRLLLVVDTDGPNQ